MSMESPRFGLDCDPDFKWWESDNDTTILDVYDTNKLYKTKSLLTPDSINVKQGLNSDDPTKTPFASQKIANNEPYGTELIDCNALSRKLHYETDQPVINVCLEAPKKETIAERIHNGKLMFYQEFIEAEFAKDYVKINNTPLTIIQPSRAICTEDESAREPFSNNSSIDKPQPDTNIKNQSPNQSHLILENENSPKWLKPNECIDEVTDDIQREELLKGELPTFFNTIKVKQIHPKDKIVSYNCLANYARYVDKVTKCPLLQSEMQGISAFSVDERSSVDSGDENAPINVYSVSDSQINKAREILKERKQCKVEEDKKSNFKIVRKLQKYEEPKIIKGRYAI